MQLRSFILLFLALLFFPEKSIGSITDSACASALQRKSFVFEAQWATAHGGARRQLAPPYYLTLMPDSLIFYLPFYGCIYRVPTPQELRFMTIDVTSTSFKYDLRQNKRKIRNLHIVPTDHNDVQSLRFTITKDCYCTLWVRSVGRDPMLYEGIIEVLP